MFLQKNKKKLRWLAGVGPKKKNNTVFSLLLYLYNSHILTLSFFSFKKCYIPRLADANGGLSAVEKRWSKCKLRFYNSLRFFFLFIFCSCCCFLSENNIFCGIFCLISRVINLYLIVIFVKIVPLNFKNSIQKVI